MPAHRGRPLARLALALLLANVHQAFASDDLASVIEAEPALFGKLAAQAVTRELTPEELQQAQAAYAAKLKAEYIKGVQAKNAKLNATRAANVTATKAKKPPPKKPLTPKKALPGGNPKKAEEQRKLNAKIAALKKKWAKKDSTPLRPRSAVPPRKAILKKSKLKPGAAWKLRKPAGVAVPRRKSIGGGTPATISCPNMACLSDLDHLFTNKLTIPAKLPSGQGDLAKVFDLKAMTQRWMTSMGKGFCDLLFKGSDIKDQSFGTTMPSELIRYLKPLFNAMPLVDDQYYFVAAAFSANPPDKALNAAADVLAGYDASVAYIKAGMALAINPCKHDYVFQFVGAEAPPITLYLIEITIRMDSFGWSEGSTLLSSNTVEGEPAIDPEFWVPGADDEQADLVVNGKFFYQGGVSIKPKGSNDFASISLEGTARMFLDPDPLNDGSGGKDFALALQLSAAPAVTIGLIEIPLDKMIGSATTRLYMSYGTSFTMAISLKIDTGKGLGPLFESFGIMPDSVSDALGTIFGSVVMLKSVDVYGGPDSWGLRIILNGNGGALKALGGIMDILHKIDSSIPNQVDPLFAISGPTTGNGLPIAVTLGLTNVGELTLYICARTSDCPGGYSCTLGICLKIECPAGSYATGPLSCWRHKCPDGYDEVLGVCWEKCPAGTVDIGVDCKYCPNSATPYYDTGFCYVGCRPGYRGTLTMCVGESCKEGYTNMGLTCFRPYASYGKGCSHWYMKCNPVWCNPVRCDPIRCWWDWGLRCSGGRCHGGDCHGGDCWWEYTNGGGCRDGYYDAGCFCARDVDSYGNTYDRGVGKLPSTYSKKTTTMAVLPIIRLPPKPSGQDSVPDQFQHTPSPVDGGSSGGGAPSPSLPRAAQSSTGAGGDALRAIDGNTAGNYGDNSCTHTAGGESKPWWAMVLPANTVVSTVTIYNRADCCSDRLKAFSIYVGSTHPTLDPTFWATATLCQYQSAAQTTQKAVYTCNKPLSGSVLAVRLDNSDYLTLCEVKVNADPAAASYTDQGCFADNGNRMVPTLLDGSRGASITIKNCASLAKTGGYSVFSLQDGGECWGGKDLARAKSLGASSGCKNPCTGDRSVACGGPWANQVFSFTVT